jgi:tRNA-modifying protein YgfZ
MSFNGAILAERAVTGVSGPDARAFLQGIVTVDISDVGNGVARHGALLTPQGKILFEFAIAPDGDDAFLLDVHHTLAEDLVKRLTFYKLRAKVEIVRRDDLMVAALWGAASSPPIGNAFADPRLAELGWRAILPRDEAHARLETAGATIVGGEAYHAHRIAHGVAELGTDYATGELFPHEAGLDQLAGVDFDKGCFVGQEVVSRMQHRGTARKRFVLLAVPGEILEPGTQVTAGGKMLGTTGAGAEGKALALIRLDRLGDSLAAGNSVEAGGVTVTPVRPAWARFDWPDAT